MRSDNLQFHRDTLSKLVMTTRSSRWLHAIFNIFFILKIFLNKQDLRRRANAFRVLELRCSCIDANKSMLSAAWEYLVYLIVQRSRRHSRTLIKCYQSSFYVDWIKPWLLQSDKCNLYCATPRFLE